MFIKLAGGAFLTERKAYPSPKKAQGTMIDKRKAGWDALHREQEHGPASVFRTIPVVAHKPITHNVTIPPRPKPKSVKADPHHVRFADLNRMDGGGLRFNCIRIK